MVVAASPSPAKRASASISELSELTPYAKKLPKVRTSSSTAEARQAEIAHGALQKIVAILQKRSDLVLDVLGDLELKIGENKAPNLEEEEFDNVSTLLKLPSQWWAGWLQSSSGCKLTDSLLAQMLVQDSNCIENIVKFSTQLIGSTAVLPKSLKICKLAARIFDEQSRTLGSPLSSVWVENHVAKNRTINWGKGGWHALHGLLVAGYGQPW